MSSFALLSLTLHLIWCGKDKQLTQADHSSSLYDNYEKAVCRDYGVFNKGYFIKEFAACYPTHK